MEVHSNNSILDLRTETWSCKYHRNENVLQTVFYYADQFLSPNMLVRPELLQQVAQARSNYPRSSIWDGPTRKGILPSWTDFKGSFNIVQEGQNVLAGGVIIYTPSQ